VATCHDASISSIFRRGIKPGNYIVTNRWTFNQDGFCERKVVIKLSEKFRLGSLHERRSLVGHALVRPYSSLFDLSHTLEQSCRPP
jgi:hypothetical protein